MCFVFLNSKFHEKNNSDQIFSDLMNIHMSVFIKLPKVPQVTCDKQPWMVDIVCVMDP